MIPDVAGSYKLDIQVWGQQMLDSGETQKAIVETRNTPSRVERTLQNALQTILNRI